MGSCAQTNSYGRDLCRIIDVLTGFIYLGKYLGKQMSFSQHLCCKYSMKINKYLK
jgi:hypothetical protein